MREFVSSPRLFPLHGVTSCRNGRRGDRHPWDRGSPLVLPQLTHLFLSGVALPPKFFLACHYNLRALLLDLSSLCRKGDAVSLLYIICGALSEEDEAEDPFPRLQAVEVEITWEIKGEREDSYWDTRIPDKQKFKWTDAAEALTDSARSRGTISLVVMKNGASIRSIFAMQ